MSIDRLSNDQIDFSEAKKRYIEGVDAKDIPRQTSRPPPPYTTKYTKVFKTGQVTTWCGTCVERYYGGDEPNKGFIPPSAIRNKSFTSRVKSLISKIIHRR